MARVLPGVDPAEYDFLAADHITPPAWSGGLVVLDPDECYCSFVDLHASRF
jgi:hypothetical protein